MEPSDRGSKAIAAADVSPGQAVGIASDLLATSARTDRARAAAEPA